jgi:integrase
MEGLSKIPEDDRDTMEFGFDTGLRPGETCALKVKDIDINKIEATIQRTWSGGRIRETTKSNHKDPIDLSDRAFEIAKKHIQKKAPELSLKEAWLKYNDDFIFINPKTNRSYKVKKLNELWKKHSGINCVHYEASRHSFCTQISETGADSKEQQQLMRHRDGRSTEKYKHPRKVRMRRILNARGKETEVFKIPICGEEND